MAIGDKLRALEIKANLIADNSVGLMDLDVEVNDGIAILTGEVESEEQKSIAEKRAAEVEGIYEVENHIRVAKPNGGTDEVTAGHFGYGQIEGDAGDTTFSLSDEYVPPGPGMPASEQFPGAFDDEEIQQAVRDKIASQKEVDASKIQARVVNQIVHLTGCIKNVADLNKLQDIIINVRGVMAIANEVYVEEGEV